MDTVIQTLKALCSDTRVRLVRLLLEQEHCVCALMDALDMPQYHVSHHLSILKKAGLVKDRRCGTWAYYSLSPELSEEQKGIIAAVCKAGEADPSVLEDDIRLRRHMPRSQDSECCSASA